MGHSGNTDNRKHCLPYWNRNTKSYATLHDINLKATDGQDKQTETREHGQWTSGHQRVGAGGRGEVDGAKGGQKCSDREKSNCGR